MNEALTIINNMSKQMNTAEEGNQMKVTQSQIKSSKLNTHKKNKKRKIIVSNGNQENVFKEPNQFPSVTLQGWADLGQEDNSRYSYKAKILQETLINQPHKIGSSKQKQYIKKRKKSIGYSIINHNKANESVEQDCPVSLSIKKGKNYERKSCCKCSFANNRNDDQDGKTFQNLLNAHLDVNYSKKSVSQLQMGNCQQQFCLSHIDILKTHAKNLQSEEFIRDLIPINPQTKLKIQQDNKEYKKIRIDTQTKSQWNNKIFTKWWPKNSYANKTTKNQKNSHPNLQNTYSSHSETNYQYFRKAKQSFIRTTFNKSLKIQNASNNHFHETCQKNTPQTKNQIKNSSSQISTQIIHHIDNVNMSFQRFFIRNKNSNNKSFLCAKSQNRNRNKRQCIKTEMGVHHVKTKQFINYSKNPLEVKIKGRRLNTILSHTTYRDALNNNSN